MYLTGSFKLLEIGDHMNLLIKKKSQIPFMVVRVDTF